MSRISAAQGRLVLSRELSEFLMDLLGAHQRHQMYPEGHPLLEPAVKNVLRRLEAIFLERDTLAIGVSPNQLLIAGIPTDPNHPVLRDLAARLHRANIGALKFYRGVSTLEIVGFLRLLAAETTPGAESGHDEPRGQWANIRLFPLSYDYLSLLEEEREEESDPKKAEGWAGRLWLSLARAALGELAPDAALENAEPEALAEAFDKASPDAAHDERVIQSLGEFLSAFQGRGRTEALEMQRQLARMVGALKGSTRERLLKMGGDFDKQRRFLFDVTQVMSADVVLSLVEAASAASGKTISPTLLKLFAKLATHAQRGPAPMRAKADMVFRQRVKQLIEGWSVDEAPGESPAYEDLPRQAPSSDDPTPVYASDPDRIIRMSIELLVVELGTRRAVDRMIETDRIGELLDLVEALPVNDLIARDLRKLIYARHTIRKVLGNDPIDYDLLARLAPGTGHDAVVLLLDALAEAKDRKVRAKLLDLVATLGPIIGPEVAARINGAPWFVQRNLLRLLAALPSVPEGFSLEQCLAHPDPRVRHEGLKILLKDPNRRGEALRRALAAPDPPTLRLGIQSALEECPPSAVPRLIELLSMKDLDSGLRSSAVRAIAPVEDEQVVTALLKLCQARSFLPFMRRLAPRSPEMIAALQGLAAHWAYHPKAMPVLAKAARNKDTEVRKATEVQASSMAGEAEYKPPMPKVLM
ncbi:MAG: hypothetical protein ABJC74_10280 [Gemmatimonadota bacterium]